MFSVPGAEFLLRLRCFMASFQRHFWFGVCALLLVVGLAAALTRPFGEFALNDDWIFARAVQDFSLETFRLDSFIVPVFMGQLLYAKGLVSLFGFSLTLLHVSTFVFALIGVMALYRLFLWRVGVGVAVIGSLALFFQPLFYNLSFSFMTDVPALSLVIVSLSFYGLWWNSPRLSWLWLAQFFAIYAATIRQNYAAVFVASFFLLLMQPDRRAKKLGLLAGVFPGLILSIGLYFFLQVRGWWPMNIVSFHVFHDLGGLWEHMRTQFFYIWQYVSFLLIPVLFLATSSLTRACRWYVSLAAGLGAGLNIILFSVYEIAFPFFGNVWTKYGLGVRTDVLSGVAEVVWPTWMSFCVTGLVGAASGIVVFFLVESVVRSFWRRSDRVEGGVRGYEGFLLLILLSQMAALLLFRSFDRYYLSVFVPALVLAIFCWIRTPPSRTMMVCAGCWIVCLALFSVMGTREYISLTRVKWLAADGLVRQGVVITDIDGGYEWLGWHWYKKGNPEILPYYDPKMPWYITTLVPEVTRKYVLSYSPVLEGYRLISTYSYEHTSRTRGKLYVLKKE